MAAAVLGRLLLVARAHADVRAYIDCGSSVVRDGGLVSFPSFFFFFSSPHLWRIRQAGLLLVKYQLKRGAAPRIALGFVWLVPFTTGTLWSATRGVAKTTSNDEVYGVNSG